MSNENIFLFGMTIDYARFVTPKVAFGKEFWEVTATFASDEDAKAAAELGFIVKQWDDNGKYFVSLRREVYRNNGQRNYPPIVVDKNKQPIDGKLVGPGSTINIKCYSFEYIHNSQICKGHRFTAIQCVEQVFPNSRIDAAVEGFDKL